MEERIIYADNAATTPLSETAFSTMSPYFKILFGNASSAHTLGIASKKAVEDSRKKIANAINAYSSEIFFTSGGSEADNWALQQSLSLKKSRGKHIIISSIEHSAVYRTAEYLGKQGCQITYLPVDEYGIVSSALLKDSIKDDTVLISIMLANNEIGTIEPIKELCKIAHDRNVIFHTDAVQAVGHIKVDVRDLEVDMLSMSSHKFGGPKGVGALYIKMGLGLPPMVFGGGQEKNRRSGTENVPGIVGMAAALEEAVSNIDENTMKITAMRDKLIQSVLQMEGSMLTGHPVNRLPGIASFLFHGLESKSIVAGLNKVGICASSGSACSSGSTELTRTLKGTLNTSEETTSGALRLSLSENNTDEEIEYIIHELPNVINELRAQPKPLLFDKYDPFDEDD